MEWIVLSSYDFLFQKQIRYDLFKISTPTLTYMNTAIHNIIVIIKTK